MERLERVVGTKVLVLGGEEEARLCFIGQCAGVWTGPGPTLGMDLGGGSLEAAVGDSEHLSMAMSAAIGPARLRGELGTGDPLSVADQVALRARTAEALAPIVRAVSGHPGVTDRTVVSGGTVRALARLATARARRRPSAGPGEVNQVELPASQVLRARRPVGQARPPGSPGAPGDAAAPGAAPSGGRGGLGHGGVGAQGGAIRRERVGPTRRSDPGRAAPSLNDQASRPGTRQRRRTQEELVWRRLGRWAAQTVQRRTVEVLRCLLAQDPVHLGAARRTRPLRGPPAIRELDFLTLELPLFTTFHTVTLVRSHARPPHCAPRQITS